MPRRTLSALAPLTLDALRQMQRMYPRHFTRDQWLYRAAHRGISEAAALRALARLAGWEIVAIDRRGEEIAPRYVWIADDLSDDLPIPSEAGGAAAPSPSAP